MNTSRNGKNILLVGETYFIQNELAQFFQEQGFDVMSIGSDGKELLTGISINPEIIILDYEMQHNDPYLVTAILHKALPTSFIALMNGHSRHCDQAEAMSAGAHKILSRTCDALEFEHILQGIEEEVHA